MYKATENEETHVISYSEILPAKWDDEIGKGIVNSQGVFKTILISFQIWTSKPFLFASILEEKSCYLSTGNFNDYSSGSNTDVIYILNDNYNDLKPWNFFNESNPIIPFESPNCN